MFNIKNQRFKKIKGEWEKPAADNTQYHLFQVHSPFFYFFLFCVLKISAQSADLWASNPWECPAHWTRNQLSSLYWPFCRRAKNLETNRELVAVAILGGNSAGWSSFLWSFLSMYKAFCAPRPQEYKGKRAPTRRVVVPRARSVATTGKGKKGQAVKYQNRLVQPELPLSDSKKDRALLSLRVLELWCAISHPFLILATCNISLSMVFIPALSSSFSNYHWFSMVFTCELDPWLWVGLIFYTLRKQDEHFFGSYIEQK
jgi:hypothetical protein